MPLFSRAALTGALLAGAAIPASSAATAAPEQSPAQPAAAPSLTVAAAPTMRLAAGSGLLGFAAPAVALQAQQQVHTHLVAQRRAEQARAARAAEAKRAQARAVAAKKAKAAAAKKAKAAATKRAKAKASRSSRTGGSPQAIARSLVSSRGWSVEQFRCLDRLWTKESNWRVTADNPTSSAYGIPQALPGSKMASHGADWRTNPSTQIRWGLDYIADRYGSPCTAWAHSRANNWY